MTDTPDYDLVQRWEAALRSGEYKQGNSLLKYTDSGGALRYCCLGVLCEVGGVEGLPADSDFAAYPRYLFDGCSLAPPLELLDRFAGKHISDMTDLTLALPPEIDDQLYSMLEKLDDEERETSRTGSNGEYAAAYLNDTIGLTFEQIADCVRFSWPEAFAE